MLKILTKPGQNSETFDVEKILGQGTYGIVYLVNDKDNEQFAIKRIDQSTLRGDEREMINIWREIDVLSRNVHPHILRYIDSWETENCMCIKTEYCANTDLWTYVKINDIPPEQQFTSWIGQIASALKHLHEGNFIHRNVKPSNVMVTEDTSLLKLGDFGTSRRLPASGYTSTVIGTPYFMSPEMIHKEPYGQSTDIWSLGCLCYAVATLKILHTGKTFQEILSTIRLLKETEQVNGIHFSDTVKDLIRRMLSVTPDNRPTAQGIIDTIEWSEDIGASSTQTIAGFLNPALPPIPILRQASLDISKKVTNLTDLSQTCPPDFYKNFNRSSKEPVSPENGSGSKESVDYEKSCTRNDLEYNIQRLLVKYLGEKLFLNGLACAQNQNVDNDRAMRNVFRAIGENNYENCDIFFGKLRQISMYNDQ